MVGLAFTKDEWNEKPRMLGNLAKNLDAGLRPRASDFYDAGSFLTVHLFIITLKSFFFLE